MSNLVKVLTLICITFVSQVSFATSLTFAKKGYCGLLTLSSTNLKTNKQQIGKIPLYFEYRYASNLPNDSKGLDGHIIAKNYRFSSPFFSYKMDQPHPRIIVDYIDWRYKMTELLSFHINELQIPFDDITLVSKPSDYCKDCQGIGIDSAWFEIGSQVPLYEFNMNGSAQGKGVNYTFKLKISNLIECEKQPF